MLIKNKKNCHVIPVGVWPHNEILDTLWFDHQEQAHCLSVNMQHEFTVPQQIIARLTTDSATPMFRLKFISALPAQHIWHKTFILPQQLNGQECEQQCRFSLENELPVTLDELWFDYCSTPLKQGVRLDIFAVMRNIAESRLATLSLPIEVLDHVAHCILRAFHYLLPDSEAPTLYLYQDAQGCLALQDRPHQLQLIQKTSQNLTAVFSQYCDRYQEQPERVVVYGTPNNTNAFPPEWQVVQTELPFIALGAALWQRSLQQDEQAY